MAVIIQAVNATDVWGGKRTNLRRNTLKSKHLRDAFIEKKGIKIHLNPQKIILIGEQFIIVPKRKADM